MGGPPSIPVDRKTRIALSALAGEGSIAQPASREKVSEQSIERWRRSSARSAGPRLLLQGHQVSDLDAGGAPQGRQHRCRGRQLWASHP